MGLYAVVWRYTDDSALVAQTRPLQTEQADTARAGTIVLEAGGQVIKAEPNFLTGGKRTRWEAPNLRLVYSPADNVEMDVEWTVRTRSFIAGQVSSTRRVVIPSWR